MDIYLRNINLGLSNGQTIFWTEEDSSKSIMDKYKLMFNYRNQNR